MEKYIVSKINTKNEQNEDCILVEINSDKPLLRNGAKHCRHFYINCKDEEELKNILQEFTEKVV